jgi:hypothetical protein
MIDKDMSRRLHMDWWGKCRTCRYWHGTDAGDGSGRMGNQVRWQDSPCTNPASDRYQEVTTTEGHCSKWDSFDVETALELLQEDEAPNS